MAGSNRHSWERHYPEGLRWDCAIETGPVTQLLDDAAAQCGDQTLVFFRDWRISYAGLKQEADRFATALIGAGLSDGQAVAIYLPNTPYHPIAFFGALKAGTRVIHLSPLDAPRELAHKLADSGARVIVTTNVGGLLAGAVSLKKAGLAVEFEANGSF